MKKRLSPKKVEEAIHRSDSVSSDIEKTLTISSEVRYLFEASRKSVKFHSGYLILMRCTLFLKWSLVKSALRVAIYLHAISGEQGI